MRVAIVNDLKMASEVLRRVVQSMPDAEVAWLAENGQQAVERCQQDRPDLILMDMVMPRMTGLEAVRELRGRVETKDIPIIMVTTRGEGDNVERGFESGVNDYVTKPIDGLLLLAKVRDYLGT